MPTWHSGTGLFQLQSGFCDGQLPRRFVLHFVVEDDFEALRQQMLEHDVDPLLGAAFRHLRHDVELCVVQPGGAGELLAGDFVGHHQEPAQGHAVRDPSRVVGAQRGQAIHLRSRLDGGDIELK